MMAIWCTDSVWADTQSDCWENHCEDKMPTVTHFYHNLVVMKNPQPLSEDRLEELYACRLFYQHYFDEFDFIFLIHNLSSAEFRKTGRKVFGRAISLSNSVSGIGKKQFANGARYGAPSRLKTLLVLSSRNSILGGPSLHELIHTWAINGIFPTSVSGHWGFSSANGQLGGFNRAKLKHLGDGRYTAGRFGASANFGNSIPYSPIELYLAGWIPSTQVPDLLVAENPAWIRKNDEIMTDRRGNRIFSATGFETWSIERIIEQIGVREPSHELAQREFQAAAILLVDEEHPAKKKEILTLRDHLTLFAMKRDLRKRPTLANTVNFWAATGGRASINVNMLEAYRINSDRENALPAASETNIQESSTQN